MESATPITQLSTRPRSFQPIYM